MMPRKKYQGEKSKKQIIATCEADGTARIKFFKAKTDGTCRPR